jgi:hypothetical protein
LRLVYKFSSRNYRLSAYIDLVNVLNHKNVYSYEWDFYNRTPNSATGLKSIMYMMPFVPSFGITVEF